jgi:hypothetical protein
MMHEVPKKANWNVPNGQLASYIRIKAGYDAHVAYVAETYIAAILPGFRFMEFVGVSSKGSFTEPLVIVRAIHEDTEAFALSESTRDVYIHFDAFTSEAKMWARIKAAVARSAQLGGHIDQETMHRIKEIRNEHGLD